MYFGELKPKSPLEQHYSGPGGWSLNILDHSIVEVVREKGFHLDVEDYLAGVLIMASELSRLVVNSVTAGDYGRPLRISNFINELDSGFRLLNLKNDPLRKRYDGLKYDVKKIEEVVYDLSICGLAKEQETGGNK
ncbi:translin-like [Salvelinus namaycush]|uniref:Translin n=1 Tax=Salvelinus namaycush TaxID=8040 RepID=A0A8U1C5H6_SALNM|nr:translin-like [Salvelinus namaycush]